MSESTNSMVQEKPNLAEESAHAAPPLSSEETPQDSATAQGTDTPMETQAGDQASNPENNPFWKPRPPPIMGPGGRPLSRNAMKRLIKQQKFLERKPQMRAQERLKRKQKEKERREAIDSGLIAPPPKRHKSDQIQSGITIGIDMSFDDKMMDKEVKSMVDQIKRCYSYNRTCEKIVHLALTSFTGASREEFIKRANGYETWRNFTIHEKGLEEVWPSEEISGKEHMAELKRLQAIAADKSEAIKARVLAEKLASGSTESSTDMSASTSKPKDQVLTSKLEESAAGQVKSSQSITDQEPPSENKLSALDIKALEQERLMKEEKLATIPAVKKVVYLSADSPNTITNLEEGTCYILGGIVDKNRYPNMCQNKAEELNIETAQLPIGEYIQLSSRRILTVNQVFEILLRFIECNDWKEAFLKVIPQRKLEDKPRVRRSVESWRPNHHNRDGASKSSSVGDSGSNSVASSIAGDESDHESDGDVDDNHDQPAEAEDAA
ncbi:tRNA (guanine(9)-N(1))-methyltransferase [Mortierella sp. AD011]|nr:tRNA (guanine(9)-N(1))-methyltransferase [Mortierella sp. AD010]KAF9403300.1 tRNA (guanine(9)-N(1))-methyltransferase [Mortierella sp. AD011]